MQSEVFSFQDAVVNHYETEHFCEILSEEENATQ